ncbi:dTMP kinase [Bacillus mexicanus]|uniref:dTMP kinase n=1 Tax=Bacillus mexicanus TaxID=2834415 RepID=UPI003D263C11
MNNNISLKNKYFNITGSDGVGKDTVINNILKFINNYTTFREPGGTSEAEVIREIILGIDEKVRLQNFDKVLKMDILKLTREYVNKAFDFYKSMPDMDITDSNNMMMVGEIEAYLYAASRNETNHKIVIKGIEKGLNVIGSRSVACSMAYQAGARGLKFEDVWSLNKPTLTKMPDFEIYLDIPTEIAMERLRKRTDKQDRLDEEGFEFHKKTREGYLTYYKKYCPYPVHIVDASGTVEENTRSVLEIINKY